MVVVDADGLMAGIVTTFDIAKVEAAGSDVSIPPEAEPGFELADGHP